MASVTILDDANADIVGDGVEITGDFEIQAYGNFLGGVVYIQRSIQDEPEQYSTVDAKAVMSGPGWIGVKNTGTSFYRAVVLGSLPSRGTVSINVVAIQ
jgi:hypothetical protein